MVKITNDGVEITFEVQNKGTKALSDVSVVFDAFPAGITYASNTPSVGSYTVGTRTWAVGSLAVAATANIVLTFTLQDASALPLDVKGTVSTSTTESNKTNNTVTKTITLDDLVGTEITRVVAADYTVQPGLDDVILVDASGGSITLTFPAGANFEKADGSGYHKILLKVLDDAAGVSVITLTPDAGDTFIKVDNAGTAGANVTLVEDDVKTVVPIGTTIYLV